MSTENDETMNAPDYVMCPLLNQEIEAIACIMARDAVDDGAPKRYILPEMKKLPNYEQICRACKWHNY